MDQPGRLVFEEALWKQNFHRVMGLDEVGRGCLSGPVVAAGVILSPGSSYDDYRDSKTLTKSRRELLAEQIRNEARYWTIRYCSPKEIDQMNILKASIAAMVKCTEAGGEPDYLLVDGNRYTSSLIPYQCVIKGDDRSASIGAASILAKVYRDQLMKNLHDEYPYYGWETNVGYPTQEHYQGLKKYGFTEYHRKSFSLKTEHSFEDMQLREQKSAIDAE
jgi:ribonuclease HII